MKSLKLYTVPLGASMRDEFCEELQKLPAGAGVMVLPTGLLQEEVKQKYNLPCSGFDTMATKIINLNGYVHLQEVNRNCQELYIGNILQYYAEQGQFTYFAQLKDKQGFVKHMTSLLGQMARSGATVEEVVNALHSWGRSGAAGLKDKEIALVYKGYRQMLQMDDMFDLEGKYRLALKILKEQAKPRVPWSYVYISDFATLDALQLEFLLALAEHCEVKVGICYNSAQSVFETSKRTVERLASASKPEVRAGRAPRRTVALQHLVDNIGKDLPLKASVQAQELELREYKDQRKEIEGVLAEIKENVLAGAKLSDFAVAVRNLNDYTGLRRFADRLGLPVNLPEAMALAAQPLTELLQLLLLAVVDNRQGAMAYFSILDNAVSKIVFTQNDLESLAWLRKERFFGNRSSLQAEIKAKVGANDFLALIDELLADVKDKATIAEYTQVLESFISNLELAKRLGALYKAEQISLQGLQTMLAVESKLKQVFKQLREDYEDCDLAKQLYSLNDFRKLWQECLEETMIMLGKARKDGLLITDVVQLQGASFANVYILGLREGEFPAGNRENWLYNDKERGELLALGIDLPNTFAAYGEDNCLFAGAVAAAKEKLVLTYYKDEEAEESPYVDDVQALFIDLEVTNANKQHIACQEEALAASGRCDENWLKEQIGSETLEAAQVDKERQAIYRGLLGQEELIKAVTKATQYRFSASSLNGYVECPFKYLGYNIWQQEAFEDCEELPDAATKGSLIHDTLALFVGRYLDGKPASDDYNVNLPLLKADYEQTVAKYMQKDKVIDNEFWPSESANIWRSLCWWLYFELKEQVQWASFKPMALERSFGYKDVNVKLKTADNLPVYLKGRVDRIDANDEQIFITDYKSGKAPGEDDLQMSFYLLAAHAMCPDKEILGGDFVSMKERKRCGGLVWSHTGNANIGDTNVEFADEDEALAVCAERITAPVSQIYSGSFEIAPAKGACDYCDLKDMCRWRVLDKQSGGEANESATN